MGVIYAWVKVDYVKDCEAFFSFAANIIEPFFVIEEPFIGETLYLEQILKILLNYCFRKRFGRDLCLFLSKINKYNNNTLNPLIEHNSKIM